MLWHLNKSIIFNFSSYQAPCFCFSLYSDSDFVTFFSDNIDLNNFDNINLNDENSG